MFGSTCSVNSVIVNLLEYVIFAPLLVFTGKYSKLGHSMSSFKGKNLYLINP